MKVSKTRIVTKECDACDATDKSLVDISIGKHNLTICGECVAELLISLLQYASSNLKSELKSIENHRKIGVYDRYEINKDSDGGYHILHVK